MKAIYNEDNDLILKLVTVWMKRKMYDFFLAMPIFIE